MSRLSAEARTAARAPSPNTFEHLGFGWMPRNIDAAGTGFGVIARSRNWNGSIGTIARDLGQLTARRPDDVETIELVTHRSFDLLVRTAVATGAHTREGAYFVHIVDITGTGVQAALALMRAGLPYSSTLQFTEELPNPGVAPLRLGSQTRSGGPSDEFLGLVAAAILAYLDNAIPRIGIVGATPELFADILYRVVEALPSGLADGLLFAWSAADLAHFGADPRIVGAPAAGELTGPRLVLDHRDSATTLHNPAVQAYLGLAATLLSLRRDDNLPDHSIGDVPQLRQWLSERQLRTRPVKDLSDSELVTLLVAPDSEIWLQAQPTMTAVVRRAITTPPMLRALANRFPRNAAVELEIFAALYDAERLSPNEEKIVGVAGLAFADYQGYAVQRFMSGFGRTPAPSSVRRIVFPVITASPTLLEPSNRSMLERLMDEHEFRIAAAAGHPLLAQELVCSQLSLRSSRRDLEALDAAVRHDGDAVERAVRIAVDPEPAWTAAWILESLPLAAAASALRTLIKRGQLPPLDILSILGASQRHDQDVHRVFAEIWPEVSSALGVPDRLAPWLLVDEIPRQKRSATSSRTAGSVSDRPRIVAPQGLSELHSAPIDERSRWGWLQFWRRNKQNHDVDRRSDRNQQR
ncbi:hypothetical protein ACFVAV_25265 [Nocardia sp. NPDC057663]|uniref:hypothetical protein n=1 Tax=Nocardia sp. NPDC057663 TaxID=3346201 RepID=UPI00366C17BC